jgi:thiamine-phosphate pyrophosphorylase
MKQLIVISSSEAANNEAGLINALFDEGLELFHLRKPNDGNYQIVNLLEQIKPAYHSRIVLPANLLKTLPFVTYISKRLHFFEHQRIQTDADEFNHLKKEGYSVSTSIHDASVYHDLHDAFDYTFYGPVFDSISKKGYRAMSKEHLNVSAIKSSIRLIALGGIHEGNCLEALNYGFDGVALLGAIWQDDTPVAAFKRIQNIIKQVE